MIPRCLVVVEQVCGEQVARDLALYFGPGKLYIPSRPTAEFVEILGQSQAEELCRLFGSWMVHIPRHSRSHRQEIRRRIYQNRHLGVNALSERFGMTPRGIRQILNSTRNTDAVPEFRTEQAD